MPSYKGKCGYDFDTDSVNFHLHEGEQTLYCSISREALQDHFGLDGEPIAIFTENETQIVNAAAARHVAGKTDPDGWVRLRSADRF